MARSAKGHQDEFDDDDEEELLTANNTSSLNKGFFLFSLFPSLWFGYATPNKVYWLIGWLVDGCFKVLHFFPLQMHSTIQFSIFNIIIYYSLHFVTWQWRWMNKAGGREWTLIVRSIQKLSNVEGARLTKGKL